MADPRRVLIVDDDPDTVLYLRSVLEDHGFDVATGSDAEQALEQLETYEPHLILLDVILPGRSGLDLLVRLRKESRWADTPLVVVTGDDQILRDGGMSYVSSHAGVRGPDRVLGKPIDRERFLATVRELAG